MTSGSGPRGAGDRADKVFQRVERAVTREIAGETLLVPIRGDAGDMHYIFAMNAVAARLWAAIDGATPMSGLVASTCETFDVERERAEEDVAAFLGELVDAGLVREV